MEKYCQIEVLGRVQGVAFRYYTRLKARELGVFGTVENRMDGSVLIFVFGQEEAVNRMIEWCHGGSPASIVEKVIVQDLGLSRDVEYREFSILR